ncbi:MAG: hypothetical protein AMJ69_03620 [Gammaproteobacteria bacterium SG8_47]|nr:MAG: hypothetical protein AMJ69_03620 [Gammaproteobacteria bacterium SG8_47]
MWLLDQLAEARITEASVRGELDDLAGAGRPLVLDDDIMVPEHLRVAYRVLKNAGCVPPQVELLREVRDIEALLRGVDDQPGRRALSAKLQWVSMRLRASGWRQDDLRFEQAYYDRLQHVLGGG